MTLTSAKHLSIQQLEWVDKLIQKPKYPFACWRMPGEKKSHLIVSLQEPLKNEQSLSELPSGFVVNAFVDNHPLQLKLINADLVINEDGEVEKGKNITDIHVQEFLDDVQPAESTSHQPVSNQTLVRISKDDREGFMGLVEQAVSTIKNASLDKVVLSRYVDYEQTQPFCFSNFFQRITSSYPHSFCNIWSLGDGVVWVGASPETLVEQDDVIFKTASLAGTQPLLDQDISEISWKQKEIEEQALVSRYIINCFKKLRVREFEEYGPKTVAAGSLAHLITTYKVNTEEIRFEHFADAMTELLHPTSAVCGMPMITSIDFIHQHEGYDREYYAGFIGPVNFTGKTHLFVNLRCMKIQESVARIYAGAGITEDSIPEKEYTETVLKMDILRSKITA